MKGFDVLKIKSAVKAHNKFDLSFTHLTTAEFGQIFPLLSKETVPGDKFNINAHYFSRLAPLVKPTYGKFSFKTVNAFVPYHQVAVDAEAWLAGKTVFEGQTPRHRFFTVQTLDEFIRTYCVTTVGATAANSQYTYLNSSETPVYNIFTNVGRYYVKILNCLGYALPQGVSLKTTSGWYTTVRTYKLSAYPLLAFFKLYNDYMSQSQRFNTSVLSDMLYKIKYNISYSTYYATTGELYTACLRLLMQNIMLNYENDYFTSAWQNANAPIGTQDFLTSGNVPPSGTGQVSVTANNTTLSGNVSGSSFSLPQRALDFLRSFDDWVRRNNYSGSRAVQQIYSKFGIKTDDYKSHYAHVLGTDVLPVQVGDVTATTQATGQALGDYAGKGIMNGAKGFSVDVSDYGLILVVGYFTVVPMNAYGFDRSVLRNSPLDYYNAEFDGLGAEAIPIGEVWESPIVDANNDNSFMTDVFGFTERYNSYRYGRDMITGDFRNYDPSNSDANCWHTGRNLSALRAGGGLVAQSTSMNTFPQKDSEYNRLFSVTSGDVDHFYLTCQFDVSAVRPMLNLNQVVRLGEGDTVVPRNGNVIS